MEKRKALRSQLQEALEESVRLRKENETLRRIIRDLPDKSTLLPKLRLTRRRSTGFRDGSRRVDRAERLRIMHRLIASLLKAFLVLLEQIFAVTRVKVTPLYPYDKRINVITLPSTIRKELLELVAAGNKAEAIKRVARLTGAGLRTSKDYVDGLQR